VKALLEAYPAAAVTKDQVREQQCGLLCPVGMCMCVACVCVCVCVCVCLCVYTYIHIYMLYPTASCVFPLSFTLTISRSHRRLYRWKQIVVLHLPFLPTVTMSGTTPCASKAQYEYLYRKSAILYPLCPLFCSGQVPYCTSYATCPLSAERTTGIAAFCPVQCYFRLHGELCVLSVTYAHNIAQPSEAA